MGQAVNSAYYNNLDLHKHELVTKCWWFTCKKVDGGVGIGGGGGGVAGVGVSVREDKHWLFA